MERETFGGPMFVAGALAIAAVVWLVAGVILLVEARPTTWLGLLLLFR
jgi:hypothetical protein